MPKITESKQAKKWKPYWIERQWQDRQTDPKQTYQTCPSGDWLRAYTEKIRPWTDAERQQLAVFLGLKVTEICTAVCALVPHGFQEHSDAQWTLSWLDQITHRGFADLEWVIGELQRHVGRLYAYQEFQAHDFDLAFVKQAHAVQDKAKRQLDAEIADEIRRIFGPDWPKEVTGV